MRIVNRKEFLELPKNTLYSKFELYQMGALLIKGETVADADFYTQNIADAIDGDYCENLGKAIAGEEIQLDFDCEIHDRLFDEGELLDEVQLYAVWSQADVKRLIARLSECVESEHLIGFGVTSKAQAERAARYHLQVDAGQTQGDRGVTMLWSKTAEGQMNCLSQEPTPSNPTDDQHDQWLESMRYQSYELRGRELSEVVDCLPRHLIQAIGPALIERKIVGIYSLSTGKIRFSLSVEANPDNERDRINASIGYDCMRIVALQVLECDISNPIEDG
jgi:hypothetical protein